MMCQVEPDRASAVLGGGTLKKWSIRCTERLDFKFEGGGPKGVQSKVTRKKLRRRENLLWG